LIFRRIKTGLPLSGKSGTAAKIGKVQWSGIVREFEKKSENFMQISPFHMFSEINA